MSEDDNFEIREQDSYQSKSGESFSHSQLIMISMKKCIETGSKEMRAGYYNEKRDKFGNNIITYNPDTRKEFIESVETLRMLMADDLDDKKDDKTHENIKKIKEDLKKMYNKFCEDEKQHWTNAPYPIQQQWLRQGILFRDGVLNERMPFAVEYLIEKVNAYREIFSELKKLTQTKDYYREEMYIT